MAGYVKKATRSADWNYGGSKWRLSRSKIELFTQCPRCFYIDNKFGVARPKMPSFTLNIAVDMLLKKEFDIHRSKKTSHPLLKAYGLDLIPFQHKDLNTWRENFEGIEYVHEETGMTICGAVDDVWINDKEELVVVDYKATSKEGKLDSLEDSGWKEQYNRQIGVYQWLLRKNNFKVSNTGYFLYVNGLSDKEAFDGKLEFESTLIPIEGEDQWIDKTIVNIKKCLDDDRVPATTADCDYCKYLTALGDVLRANAKKPLKSKPESSAKLFKAISVILVIAQIFL